jgi:hypothetical protein
MGSYGHLRKDNLVTGGYRSLDNMPGTGRRKQMSDNKTVYM